MERYSAHVFTWLQWKASKLSCHEAFDILIGEASL